MASGRADRIAARRAARAARTQQQNMTVFDRADEVLDRIMSWTLSPARATPSASQTRSIQHSQATSKPVSTVGTPASHVPLRSSATSSISSTTSSAMHTHVTSHVHTSTTHALADDTSESGSEYQYESEEEEDVSLSARQKEQQRIEQELWREQHAQQQAARRQSRITVPTLKLQPLLKG